MLGTNVDDDFDDLRGVDALGDNNDDDDNDSVEDEDGVVFNSPAGGDRGQIIATVTVTNTTGSGAFVCAWLDRCDGAGVPSGTLSAQGDDGTGSVCLPISDTGAGTGELVFEWGGLPPVVGLIIKPC
jgi:hypothetical protein